MTTPYEEMPTWRLIDRIEDLETAITRYRDLDLEPSLDIEDFWERFEEAREHLYSLVPEDVSG